MYFQLLFVIPIYGFTVPMLACITPISVWFALVSSRIADIVSLTYNFTLKHFTKKNSFWGKVYSKQQSYFLQIMVYVLPASVGKSYNNVGLRFTSLRFAFDEINGSLTLTVAKKGFGFSPLACFSAFPLTKTTSLGTRRRQFPPKCDVMLIFCT